MMSAKKLTLEIPGEVVRAVRIPPKEIERELLKELAVALYRRGALSFGKARLLAQMTHWEFGELLGRRKVLRHYTDAELEEDIAWSRLSVASAPRGLEDEEWPDYDETDFTEHWL